MPASTVPRWGTGVVVVRAPAHRGDHGALPERPCTCFAYASEMIASTRYVRLLMTPLYRYFVASTMDCSGRDNPEWPPRKGARRYFAAPTIAAITSGNACSPVARLNSPISRSAV